MPLQIIATITPETTQILGVPISCLTASVVVVGAATLAGARDSGDRAAAVVVGALMGSGLADGWGSIVLLGATGTTGTVLGGGIMTKVDRLGAGVVTVIGGSTTGSSTVGGWIG